ncbi:MAG: methyl-accepting chemotaxis protein [Clostridia bacterium]|nr:methyl-accepting chemotaxis protein [Clostridia bacterium]
MKRLGLKILAMISVLMLVAMAIVVALNGITFTNEFSALKDELLKDAADAVKAVDGDKLQAVLDKKTMDCPEYMAIQNDLIRYKSFKDIRFVYTMIEGPGGKALYAVDGSVGDEAGALDEEYGPLDDQMKQALQGKAAVNLVPVTDELGTFLSAYAPIKNSSGKVIAFVGVDKEVSMFVHVEKSLSQSILWAAGVILVLSIAGGAVFSRIIGNNVRKIRNALKQMAEGDLTQDVTVHTKDEFQSIAQAINSFRKKFSQSLVHVKSTSHNLMSYSEGLSALSEELAATSKEVSEAVDSVARNTGHQASEFDNINRAVASFGDKLGQVTAMIGNINKKISTIDQKAHLSNEDLAALEIALKDIISAFSGMNVTIENFGAKLSQIYEITDVINSIADQTNMIALNASIEAARAGEMGRGFAVVADEIRKLAEQSKNSSQTINSLLESVSQQSAALMETSTAMNAQLDREIKTISSSVASFKEIISNIDEVTPGIHKISENIRLIDGEKQDIIRSIGEVSQRSEEISAASQQISASTEQSSTSSQEVAEAAQKLIDKAQDMVSSVSQFKTEA